MVLRILRFQLRPVSLQLSTEASTANLLLLFFLLLLEIEYELKAFDWKTPSKIQDIGGHFFITFSTQMSLLEPGCILLS